MSVIVVDVVSKNVRDLSAVLVAAAPGPLLRRSSCPRQQALCTGTPPRLGTCGVYIIPTFTNARNLNQSFPKIRGSRIWSSHRPPLTSGRLPTRRKLGCAPPPSPGEVALSPARKEPLRLAAESELRLLGVALAHS